MKIIRFKYIIVGSGFFGATIAGRIARELNEKVLVIERRNHIAGNCYSEVDTQTGIECHKYGSHIFHTSQPWIWEYVNHFSKFNNYRHRVFTRYKGQVYQMPINLSTINAFYNKDLKPFEVEDFLCAQIEKESICEPKNFEVKAVSLVGRPLYEAFVRGYTLKQWQTDPRRLPASIITRLPVRKNYNNDYFDDVYQGIPVDGYHALFSRMLEHKNIEVWPNTNYFDVKDSISNNSLVVYTGPIDRFFDYKYGRLGWRALLFEKEIHRVEDYQGTAVMNYADESVPYTRIHEFKHYHPERKHKNKTVIFKEYSKNVAIAEEPYYPINTNKDRQILKQYEQESLKMKNVIFGGRLGTYKYLDMDDVIGNALDVFEKKIKSKVKKRPEIKAIASAASVSVEQRMKNKAE